MGVISVLLAAAAAWLFAALWYAVIGTRWTDASGLSDADLDRGDPVPHVLSYVCALLVAAMTRHILTSSGLTTAGPALVSGLGLGLFVAAPWIVMNVLYAQRSKSLIWMDGVPPVIGTALIALVLSWFL